MPENGTARFHRQRHGACFESRRIPDNSVHEPVPIEMIREPRSVASRNNLETTVLGSRVIDVHLASNQACLIVYEERQILVPRSAQALQGRFHHEHRVVQRNVWAKEALDYVENGGIRRKFHPLTSKFMRVADLLDDSRTTSASKSRQLKSLIASAEV